MNKNIYTAIANFQQEVPVILKDTTGHNYKYADLPAILEVINPLLKKHSLGFYQAVNGTKLKTVIFCTKTAEANGECEQIESETDMPFESLVYEEVKKKTAKGEEYTVSVLKGFEAMNRAQAIGSLITYFRRYSLSSMLGLVTDKDTDGVGRKLDTNEDLPF